MSIAAPTVNNHHKIPFQHNIKQIENYQFLSVRLQKQIYNKFYRWGSGN